VNLLSTLKQKFGFFLNSSALALSRVGLTPNSSTVLGLAFAAIAGLVFFLCVSDVWTFVVAPFLVLISGFFDAVDGALARLHGETRFGGVLDSTFDRFAEIFILSGIVLGGLASPLWGVASISASLMVSYVRARVEVEGLKMSGIGFAERPERLLILVTASFLRSIEYGIIVIVILSIVTVIHRILYAYRHLN
jgi:archaetidylinositol phosphate synthase